MEDKTEQEAEPELFEKGIDLRLATAAVAAWAGVLLGLGFGLRSLLPTVSFALITAICALAASALIALLARAWSGVAKARPLSWVLTVVIALSAVVGQSAGTRFVEDPATTAAKEGSFVTLTLRVSSHPAAPDTPFGQDTRVFKASATSLQVGDAWVPASADLWVSLAGFTPQTTNVPVPGAILQVTGALKQEEWLTPPYAGSLKAASFKQTRLAPPWQVASSKLRTQLREAVEPAGINAPLIRGMAIGDDAGLPKRTKDAMLTSSLTHLTAVSGTHIGVTLALVVWATRGRPRVQAALAASFLVVIVILVGPAPSVIRASLTSALAVWATLRRRPFQPLALLGAVALGVLLVSPWLARSLGFALSSAATAGIVLFARPLTTWLTDRLPKEGRARKLLAPVMAAVAVALTAQISTLFILPFANPWLPTWGVVANLLVAPIVPLLTLLSVGVAATCWWAPPLAAVLVKLATPLANWVAGVALWVSDLPFARLPWPQGPTGAALAIALTAAGLLVAHWLSDLRRGR